MIMKELSMVEFFKAEDFRVYADTIKNMKRQVVEQANRILAERGVRVRCGIEQATDVDRKAGWLADETGTHSVYTHEGLLFPLQPIAKECSEHVPKVFSPQVMGGEPAYVKFALGCRIVCAKCGVTLEPTAWKALGAK